MAQSDIMLQVVSKILQNKTAQQEADKDRAFKVRLQDIQNQQAKEMINLQGAEEMKIIQKKSDVQKAMTIALAKDPDIKAEAVERFRMEAKENRDALLIKQYGSTAVADYDTEGKFLGIKPAVLKRSEIHKGEVVDAPIREHKVLDQKGGFKVDPLKYDEVAKRNPYYADPNSQFEDADQVYSKVIDRLKSGNASAKDIELIPIGSRSRYKEHGFDTWFTGRTNADLKSSIAKKVMVGDVNVGYDEAYATDADKIKMADTYKTVKREMAPKDWFASNNNKGIYVTSKGHLYINGHYQGDGANMDGYVRNPALPGNIRVHVKADGSGGYYETLSETLAKAQNVFGAQQAILQQDKKLKVDAQRVAELGKYDWHNEQAFRVEESDLGGLDENELLEEMHRKITGTNIDGTPYALPYQSVKNQVAHAGNLWNNPQSGDMHEYRKAVIEQLSSMIRAINRDSDQRSKDKLYDATTNKNWKDFAISDPEGAYSSAVEKSTWVDWMDLGAGSFQNYANVSTYDEYVALLKKLVSMKEELMLTPKSNFSTESASSFY